MNIRDVPFTATDWSQVEPVKHKGKTGASFWRFFEQRNIRLRIVEYSAHFKSDHWCGRGHVLLILEGELIIKLKDGRVITLTPGMSFQVSDDETNPHLACIENRSKVFIVD